MVPLQRREILSARAENRAAGHGISIAPGDVEPRGVLLAEQLLTDGSSPFFTPSPEEGARRAVRHAHAALLLALSRWT